MSYGRGFEGSRLAMTKGMSRAEIAKLFRQDIKDAIKRGDLPKGLKVSVRTSEYAGGGSINARVTAVPVGFKVLNPSRVYADLCSPHAQNDRPYKTPEATALIVKLDRLLQAYNRDDSDSMTDYFDVRFYGHTDFASELESTERAAYKVAFEAGAFADPGELDYLDHREQVELLSRMTEDPENEQAIAAAAAAKMLGANIRAAPPALTKADLEGLVTGPNPRVVITHFDPPRLYSEMTYEEQGKIDAEEAAREAKKAAFMDNEGTPEPEAEYVAQLEAAGWV